MYRQILIDAKVRPGKRDQETEMKRRSALRRGRSALDCSAIEEEEEEDLVLYSFYIYDMNTFTVNDVRRCNGLHIGRKCFD